MEIRRLGVIVSLCIVYTIGLSLFERVFDLKQENTIWHKILYLFYKTSFFLSFLILWIFVFSIFSVEIYSFCKLIPNKNIQLYLSLVIILCLNLRSRNLVYFIIKISIFDRFKQHHNWIKKSNDIILYAYRFIVYIFAFIILLTSNVLSFMETQTPFTEYIDNISVLNVAFITILGFDAVCETFLNLFKYIKTLTAKS